MTITNEVINVELNYAIQRYAIALSGLEEAKETPSVQQVLDVLLARDAVAEELPEKTKIPPETIVKLIDLDYRLQLQADTVNSVGKLDEWRKSLMPPESAWWWFLQTKEQVNPWDKLDWVWNSLTAASLTAFIAYMTNLVPRFAIGGFGLLESFGVIGPSGVMALLLSSIKGGAGKQLITNSMKKLGIPSHFHSEVTFGISVLLLLSAIATNANLPKIANWYYENGRQYYEQGLLRRAEQEYQQAINLDRDNVNFYVALGEVYESLGDLDLAQKQYKEAVTYGTPEGFSHSGRIHLQQGNLAIAQTMFQIGLQRADEMNTKFQLHTNLGWSLLEQKKHDQAESYLKTAIELDKEIPGKQIGSGLANCLLAKVYEVQNNTEKTQKQWEYCQTFARPETIFEYKWIVKSAPPNLSDKIDTTAIVNYDRRDAPEDPYTPPPSPNTPNK